MAKRDFYEVLGVSKDATEDQVKSAYKKMAIKFHPDKNPGDKKAEDAFKEAAEAYDVLRDSDKRAQYDRFGHQAFENGQGGGGGGFQGGYEDIFSRFGDIFGDDAFGGMFGGGGRRSRGGPQKGEDLQIKVRLNLHEINDGVTKKIKVKRMDHCHACEGVGGKGKKTCTTCGGQGQVRQVAQSLFGQMINVVTCPKCHGNGSSFEVSCPSCTGSGLERKEATLSVTIPAGVAEGNYLTLRGEGNKGPRKGPGGDLIVLIGEEEDDIFKREGANLNCHIRMPYTTAVLGGSVRIPTLEGEVDLKIPAGSQSGKVFVLRGKGLPVLQQRGKGDLYVRTSIRVPEKLDGRHRELLEEMRALEHGTGAEKTIFDKVKDLFS